MLAICDIDSIVYECAYRAQNGVEFAPGEWTYQGDFPSAKLDFEGVLESIQDATAADDMILALTHEDRDLNFRRTVYPDYKRPRSRADNRRPLLFSALREWVSNTYNVKLKPAIEADDTVGILMTADLPSLPPREERICVAIDKDLDTVPGLHFSWRDPAAGVVEVTEQEADYTFMLQTLVGDSTDNYKGLPGCGPVTAPRILGDPGESLAAYWAKVVAAFESKGFTEADALVQARCARILQASDWDFENEEPILWEPPNA